MAPTELLLAVGGGVITILLGVVAFFLARLIEKVEDTHGLTIDLQGRFEAIEEYFGDSRVLRTEIEVLKAEFEMLKRKHNGGTYYALEEEN